MDVRNLLYPPNSGKILTKFSKLCPDYIKVIKNRPLGFINLADTCRDPA